MQKVQIPDLLKCQKQEHDEQTIQYFKFSSNIDDILQCIYCGQEDFEPNTKIVLDQLFSQPVWKIRNFPPLDDQEKSKKIRKIIELKQGENFKEFQQEILQKIEEIYYNIEEEFIKSLNFQKKQTIQTYQKFFQQMDFNNTFDIQPLKDMIYQYSKNEITLQKLFQQQLKIKEDFVSPQKQNIILHHKNVKQNIQKQLEQLENDLKNFIQSFDNTLGETLQQFENSINQTELKFYKSNYNSPNFSLNEIRIQNQNNNNNQNTIHFDKKAIKYNKQVYSQVLDKFKTHYIKMKINLNGNNKQYIRFAILDSQNKENDYIDQNSILITDDFGTCGSYNGISFDEQGQTFASFMQDDKTIFNIVINYGKKLFQIYDNDKLCYINHVINQDLIKQDMLLGIRFYQYYKLPATFTVIDYFID
ncbi:hypothetical protein PPERSA_03183 [Pseudocohnilembus persalinus]|uniref:Uncharacterized protein n=1 Tax=Pseudocohnilembus persalinus TaxID=266149 RepID=A0A0V0QE38_PSEPJ|nr:hypothetical protein PPERSA_03183 [Pseudocohnilembus persalinus]|eukprot:KRX00450.1 hypothetical protein PPERSA_03183 [Pseudocohnilembus persalinus]